MNVNDIMDASIATNVNTNPSKPECDVQLEVVKLEMHILSSQPNHKYIHTANITWFDMVVEVAKFKIHTLHKWPMASVFMGFKWT